MSSKFKLALCQMATSFDKDESMETAAHYVNQSADYGASIVCLPEMWNCPYGNKYFREYSENESGESMEFMSDLARENEIYLVGGSIPENDQGKIYNTSYVFSPNGELLGKHRKMHLFDIDIEGSIRFMESDTLANGDKITVIDTEFCKIGIAVCFDIRFPEMFMEMAKMGAELIILPASFNTTTGPSHWELLIRSRAMDNQLYLAACSSARSEDAPYIAYGHSMVSTPWGDIGAKTDHKETIVLADIDLDQVEATRKQIPLNRTP